jgi:hypothetical protein
MTGVDVGVDVGGGVVGGGVGAGAGAVTVADVTVMPADLLFPLAVAVIVAFPTATPVTRPLLETEATELLDVVHAIEEGATGLPMASSKLAVNCIVLPCWIEPVAGLRSTVLMAPAATENAAVPDFPLEVAVTVAVPTLPAFTIPVDDTLTTEELLVDQVTDDPDTELPLTSVTLALSCSVAPATMLDEPGLTETVLAEPAATVTPAEPCALPADAVIVALPAFKAVTRPLDETLAMEVFELDHATASPVSGLPKASLMLADM